MMRAILLRTLVTAVATAGVGFLARAPYTPPGSDSGVLRLSWRLIPDRTEHCRRLSQEELEKLPVHMRNPTVCERESADYQLIVQVGDAAPDTTRFLPKGAHGDRPIFVLQERGLEPGVHRVLVWFARESGEREHDREEQEERRHGRKEQEERRRQRDELVERHEGRTLWIDTNVSARSGMIELITLDPAARKLVHVSRRNRD